MKFSQKVSAVDLEQKPESQITQRGLKFSFGKHTNKIVAILCLGGVGLLTPSCVPAYVETVPIAVDTRPNRPSDLHIWIEGNWVWSNQTRTYVHQNGYWDRPRNNHTYIQGQWNATPRGHKWQHGHWQRNGRNGGNRHR